MNNNEIDELFGGQFKDFKDTPQKENWPKIEQKIREDALDQRYQKSMKDFKSAPHPKNWEKIHSVLPFHARIHRQLQKLSKIAAVLLVLMMAFTIYIRIQPAPTPLVAKLTEPNIETPALDPTVQPDYVLTIDDTQKVNQLEVNLLEEEALETELEELLALVIETDDPFDKDLDKAKLTEILQPLDQLPISDMISSNHSNRKKKQSVQIAADAPEQDLKIMVPLKVVEEHEIDRLLDIYEQQAQTSKTTSNQ